MSEQRFYVVGGEYADTSFTTPCPGTQLETFGPFATEREAKIRWRELTGQSIDNAMVRYFLTSDEPGGKKKNHWVVGGEYADTTFTRLASGKELEVYGPFEQGEAVGFWRGLASKTIDDALMRYDIRENYEGGAGFGASAPSVRLNTCLAKSITIAATPAVVFQFLMESRAWPQTGSRTVVKSDAATGVIDHTFADVTGRSWAVPGRVVAGGGGAVFMALFAKGPGMSDDQFNETMARVDTDLAALKRLVESAG